MIISDLKIRKTFLNERFFEEFLSSDSESLYLFSLKRVLTIATKGERIIFKKPLLQKSEPIESKEPNKKTAPIFKNVRKRFALRPINKGRDDYKSNYQSQRGKIRRRQNQEPRKKGA